MRFNNKFGLRMWASAALCLAAADEVEVVTINADHTYSMKEIGKNPETGTWSFNAANGVISIHGMPMYTAEASCTASQLVWAQPRHMEGDHDLVFGRLTYSKKGN